MRISSVTVGPESIEATVAFDEGEVMRTSDVPGAAQRVFDVLPGLAAHRCDNTRGAGFADEVADTELAHLVEHAALEMMSLAGSPPDLRGETVWDFKEDGRGVFRVRLAYDDDLVCLSALHSAYRVVLWAIGGEQKRPDVERQVARMLRLREA